MILFFFCAVEAPFVSSVPAPTPACASRLATVRTYHRVSWLDLLDFSPAGQDAAPRGRGRPGTGARRIPNPRPAAPPSNGRQSRILGDRRLTTLLAGAGDAATLLHAHETYGGHFNKIHLSTCWSVLARVSHWEERSGWQQGGRELESLREQTAGSIGELGPRGVASVSHALAKLGLDGREKRNAPPKGPTQHTLSSVYRGELAPDLAAVGRRARPPARTHSGNHPTLAPTLTPSRTHVARRTQARGGSRFGLVSARRPWIG